MRTVCGIDFGTSNSAIAVAAAKAAAEDVMLVPVEAEQMTIPSALFFHAAEKRVLFGRAAQQAYTQGEEGRFMRSLKRVLGSSLMGQMTVVNGKHRSFHDIITLFVRNLKQRMESVGYEADSVVMGRPVHFVDGDPAADCRAQAELERIARAVGFKHVGFQYEPIAAAFAHEQKLHQEQLSLVIDIGGGTSDFTVIRLSPARKNATERQEDILSNDGVRLGGNDFDKALSLECVMPALGYETRYGEKNLTVPRAGFHDLSEWSKINSVYDASILRAFRSMLPQSHAAEQLRRFVNVLEHQYGHRLLSSVEAAKVALTSETRFRILLEYIEKEFAIDVAAVQLNHAIEASVQQIQACIAECLRSAGVDAEDIELVVLTGGSTEIPYIQAVLSAMLPRALLSQGNKLSSVVEGLAYDARRQFGK